MQTRHYTRLDRLFSVADKALSTLFVPAPSSQRQYPAADGANNPLTEPERRHAAGLMRVNHAGEIAAQGLYQGQALNSRDPALNQQLQQAADEENDHLHWCERRLQELDSQPSRLAPLWFGGSFAIGALAGLAGDSWSLGFVAETEDQVIQHLDGHFAELPPADERSRLIITQMRSDEAEHAHLARANGGRELPQPVKTLMRWTARIMTKTAYRL